MVAQKETDWPIELRVVGLDVKRGAKFHGTKVQLKKHLATLNESMSNGVWDVDRKQLPDLRI